MIFAEKYYFFVKSADNNDKGYENIIIKNGLEYFYN